MTIKLTRLLKQVTEKARPHVLTRHAETLGAQYPTDGWANSQTGNPIEFTFYPDGRITFHDRVRRANDARDRFNRAQVFGKQPVMIHRQPAALVEMPLNEPTDWVPHV